MVPKDQVILQGILLLPTQPLHFCLYIYSFINDILNTSIYVTEGLSNEYIYRLKNGTARVEKLVVSSWSIHLSLSIPLLIPSSPILLLHCNLSFLLFSIPQGGERKRFLFLPSPRNKDTSLHESPADVWRNVCSGGFRSSKVYTLSTPSPLSLYQYSYFWGIIIPLHILYLHLILSL